MIRLAILGPQKSLNYVQEILSEMHCYLEAVYVPYTDYHEVLPFLEKSERNFDAILFTGMTPYLYASQNLTPSVIWEYLPRNKISFLSALLKANRQNGINICKISLDCYEESIVYETYREIGYQKNDILILKYPSLVTEENYLTQVCQFHELNYYKKKVGLCVTGLSFVAQTLSEKGIPCVKIEPSADAIIQQINKIQLNYQLRIKEENSLAILLIDTDFLEEYSVCNQNLIQRFKNKNQILELIYIFASKMKAAVLEYPDGRCYLFTTTADLKAETDSFTRLELLFSIHNKNIIKNVFMGIGLGETPQAAKFHAELGCQKARQNGIDCCYIVYDENSIAGPISPSNKEEPVIHADRPLLSISQQTGINTSTLQKMKLVLAQYHLDIVTPQKFAQLMHISPRSMNRLLLALEDHGYIQVVGKSSSSSPGRPSRLIRLNF
ncbi:hypothetical protein HMPREF0866_00330 [Ruminococcaceae bacterium D16]|nr:hypothetical protein HMPREF0866_00330 [Ruminococcaceae bacterium D16]